jgi:hypothetical protein
MFSYFIIKATIFPSNAKVVLYPSSSQPNPCVNLPSLYPRHTQAQIAIWDLATPWEVLG